MHAEAGEKPVRKVAAQVGLHGHRKEIASGAIALIRYEQQ
jgi:hypothetical protein